jgi:hypothetical protein
MHMGQSVTDYYVPANDPNLAPIGTTPDATSSWLTSITGLLTQGLTAYGQIRLQDLNIDLIKQGKQPLTASQVAAMAPQLNVGLASSTQNLVMYGLLGGGAVLLLMSFMKTKRSR